MSAQTHPVLIVRGEGIASPFGHDVFDNPDNLAAASEGFCPYHCDPVPVEKLADGQVRCTKDGHVQTWTWEQESDDPIERALRVMFA